MQNAQHKHSGGGLTEVLVTVVIASVAMLALLRMNVMSSVFAEQQRLATLAQIAVDDLQQRMLLVAEQPQSGGACDAACSAAYDRPVDPPVNQSVDPIVDPIVNQWIVQWRNVEPKLSATLYSDAAELRLQIAWPAHPLIPNNPDCPLSGSCLNARLYP